MANEIGRYYNEEIKKRYVEEKGNKTLVPASHLLNTFKKSAEYEFEHGKDLCDWTRYEITEYYKILNSTSLEVLINLNSVFSQYTQFCLENNLVKDNQNHYLEINFNILNNCINKAILNKKVVTRETVLEWVNELPNPKDKFILLGTFEFGKSNDHQDITNAKQDDVEGYRLKLADRTVDISDELLDIIYDCEITDEYYSISGSCTRTMPLVDYGYIVKSYPNQSIDATVYQKGRNVYASSRRIMQYLGIGDWMNLSAISESGKLHMINKRAKELGMSAVEYIYSDFIKEVETQYNCKITRSIYMKKYKEYLV